MKKEELRTGVTCRNSSGSQRRILDFGPQYKLYSSQADCDCLSYAIVKGRRRHFGHGRTEDGLEIQYSTRVSFANWASGGVVEGS